MIELTLGTAANIFGCAVMLYYMHIIGTMMPGVSFGLWAVRILSWIVTLGLGCHLLAVVTSETPDYYWQSGLVFAAFGAGLLLRRKQVLAVLRACFSMPSPPMPKKRYKVVGGKRITDWDQLTGLK